VRAEVIARNYAETLLELAERAGGAEAVEEYGAAMDEVAELLADGRVRVGVEISHAPDAALQAEIGQALANRLGKVVIPSFTVNPDLLGGVVVRIGDEILDGSVRSRAQGLRRRLLAAQLPPAGNGAAAG
jgi:F-type H+-transporting ATPase subunit delta